MPKTTQPGRDGIISVSDKKRRAPRNRTLTLTKQDRQRLRRQLKSRATSADIRPTGILLGDFAQWLPALPTAHFDLLFLDPPYNLTKDFNGRKFSRQRIDQYTQWLDETLGKLGPLLKSTATVYICGDWRTSHSIYEVADRHLLVRNRITWERERGRGARRNWKSNSEDIWFCTVSGEYFFDPEAVMLRRRVIAPYTDGMGAPKDWSRTESGSFRDTYPSNLWTDLSVPFWSMPENTDHPTQKSEKLLAKLLLASTRPGDSVLDPFAGSGTTVSVCKKLGRLGLGIEIDEEYCLWAMRRLEQAEQDAVIQGYEDGVFWERNSRPAKKNGRT